MANLADAIEIRFGPYAAKTVYFGNNLIWPSGWNPSFIPTVFWYDASDASTIAATGTEITQVIDKSGNNYTLKVDVGQNSPLTNTRTLNGLNVFEWTNNNCLEAAFTYNQAATPLNIAAVCLIEGVDDQEFIWSGTTSSTAGQRMAFRDTTPSWNIVGGSNTGINFNLNGGIAIRNQANIVLTQLNAANSLIKINGTQTISGNIGTNSFTTLQLGHNEIEVNDLNGYIAEMIAFSDNSKQLIIEGYLAWKWGLVANLPVGHPYKNLPPTN